MAKKVEKSIVVQKKENVFSQFANLTRAELIAKVRENTKERKRLAEENKELYRLYRDTKDREKTASTEAKIQALTAQLEALRNSKSK
jgi:hypothetical protein